MNAFFGRLIAYLFLGSFCLAGPVLLVIGCGSALQRAALIYAGEATQGTIVAKRPSGASHPTFAPVFQFQAADGSTYTVISDVSGREDAFALGQRVRVLYWRDRPEAARIDAFSALWTFPLVVGGVGSAFSIIPAIVLTTWLRRRRATGAGPEGTRLVPGTADSPDTPSRGVRWTLGALLGGAGAILLYAALKAWLNSTPSQNSPVVLLCMGILLTAAGVLMGQWVTRDSRLSYALGGALISSMSVLFGWVAIYGNAAGFSGGVAVGGAAVASSGSVMPARIAFGLGAIIFGLASLAAWKRVFRARS